MKTKLFVIMLIMVSAFSYSQTKKKHPVRKSTKTSVVKKQNVEKSTSTIQEEKEEEKQEYGSATDIYYDTDKTYTGETLNGVPHGKGKWTNTDGSWYEGEFKNGYANGTGILRDKNGIRYNGNFVDGSPHGVIIAKSWTLGGLISNEWYAEYDHGKLISSRKTKDDFDRFMSGGSSGNSTPDNTSSSSSIRTIPNIVKFENLKEGGSILGTTTYKYYVKYSDETTGYLYKYQDKDGGKWAVSYGVSADEYSTKEEAINALYKYKKWGER